ncbi:MAG: trimeric intracellular cation channel family protein [Clostridia bacterium]|nr:trimeric intracellular cation channel family protein [Clostridia bacterium]
MDTVDIFILLLELIGTAAFSASGSIIAIRKKMDIFGVCVLGLVTAVGGGITRDLLLGVTPPLTFRNPIYALASVIVSVIIFIKPVRRYLTGTHAVYDRTMLVADSIGLGLFTVIGVSIVKQYEPQAGVFLTVFVSVLTGVGGGMLRDVLAGQTPFIFVKHVYACASLIGAVACALLWPVTGSVPAMITGASLVFTIRILAAIFKWNLPRAD